jgi:hypothetical protein
MEDTKALPVSPNEMPHDLACDTNQVRTWMIGLSDFPYAQVNWECNVAASNASGESVGTWEVEIHVNRRTITAKHEEIENALWFAITHANAVDDARYKHHEDTRKAALAKLTDEEKRLLGLNR